MLQTCNNFDPRDRFNSLTAAMLLLAGLVLVIPTDAATLTARLQLPDHVSINRIQVIHLRPTKNGVNDHSYHDPTFKDGVVTATDLPAGDGWFSLAFQLQVPVEPAPPDETPQQRMTRQMRQHAVVQGWNANVPRSDYVEEQPLADDAKPTLRDKIMGMHERGFPDVVQILDMQGNIQNASVLVLQLRTRPFVGGGYKQGEWVLRVDRMLWHDPDEHTWSPNATLPWYALMRQRLLPRGYHNMRLLYARALGGITFEHADEVKDLGTIVIPTPPLGVHACNPDGSIIKPITIKGELP